MKILIGVDGSPCSTAAVAFVRGLKWPAGSRALVISAVQPPVAVFTEMYVPPAGAQEVIDAGMRAHRELASVAESELQSSGLAAESRALLGDPREAIVQAAKADAIDLVVVGSHGRSGIAKLLMGSVAAHVVTHAPCSVLVVKRAKSAA